MTEESSVQIPMPIDAEVLKKLGGDCLTVISGSMSPYDALRTAIQILANLVKSFSEPSDKWDTTCAAFVNTHFEPIHEVPNIYGANIEWIKKSDGYFKAIVCATSLVWSEDDQEFVIIDTGELRARIDAAKATYLEREAKHEQETGQRRASARPREIAENAVKQNVERSDISLVERRVLIRAPQEDDGA